MSITYTMLVAEPEGNSSLDGCRRSWRNIIKLYLIEFGYEDVDYTHVALGSDQWKHVNKFRGSQRSVRSRDRIVCTVPRLRAGRSGFQMPAEARDFSLLQNVKTCFGDHPASYLMGAGVHSRG
jgi:hypothetical protein